MPSLTGISTTGELHMRTIIAGCGLALAVALGTGQPALAAQTQPARTLAARAPQKSAPPAKKHPAKKDEKHPAKKDEKQSAKRQPAEKKPVEKKKPEEQPAEKKPADKQPADKHATAEQPAQKPVSSSTCPAADVGCQQRLSTSTENEQNTFDTGGAQIGEGITDVVSGAVVGLSTLGLDVLQDIGHII
jgi:outer membrane biosynthesis protein TonB